MICSDTNGKLPAIRLEHLDCQTLSKMNEIAGLFKQVFKGDGKLTLVYSGGNVQAFETNTRTPNKQKSA